MIEDWFENSFEDCSRLENLRQEGVALDEAEQKKMVGKTHIRST